MTTARDTMTHHVSKSRKHRTLAKKGSETMFEQAQHGTEGGTRKKASGFWVGMIAGLGMLVGLASAGLAQGSGGSSGPDPWKRLRNWGTPAARARLLRALAAARAKAGRTARPTPQPRTTIRPPTHLRIRTTPTVTPRTPVRLAPAPQPTGRISYGGIYYTDHSANTTMSPTTVRVGGTFRITSSTMRFAGPNTEVRVVLEVQNRRPGSYGVTRLQLRGVRISGNTLIVRGPDHPVWANQSYRVVVVTYTNRRPDSYASPGSLRVNR